MKDRNDTWVFETLKGGKVVCSNQVMLNMSQVVFVSKPNFNQPVLVDQVNTK